MLFLLSAMAFSCLLACQTCNQFWRFILSVISSISSEKDFPTNPGKTDYTIFCVLILSSISHNVLHPLVYVSVSPNKKKILRLRTKLNSSIFSARGTEPCILQVCNDVYWFELTSLIKEWVILLKISLGESWEAWDRKYHPLLFTHHISQSKGIT